MPDRPEAEGEQLRPDELQGALRLDDPQQSALRLDNYLPYRLSVASNAVSRLIARAYEDRFGLTIPQWRLIAVLAEDGPLTQQSIGVRTVMDKVTVSRATQGLVKRRLVQRAPHDVDGRSHHLALSKEGERLYSEVAPVALEYEARLLQHFDPGVVERLKEFLLHLERASAALAEPVEDGSTPISETEPLP
jgi:DNA-binding MarR family transcriptional regulator